MSSENSAVLNYVLRKSRPGDIQSVIDTIDHFGWSKQWLMNIGDEKGKILDDAIRSRRPKTILELGTFLGYSSLRMAARTPDDVLIVSVESNPQSADIARRIHQHAGVAHRIYIVVDATDRAIPRLQTQFHVDSFDFIFIDHHNNYYLRDLKLLEHEGLIQRGTMVVADNVLMPGAPDYLRYIRNSRHYTSTMYKSHVEYSNDIVDGVEVSVRV